MGVGQSQIKEAFITDTNETVIKRQRCGATEITCFPYLENNPVVLLKNNPSYQHIVNKIKINRMHRIEYDWSDKYGCYLIIDINVPSPGNIEKMNDNNVHY